MAPYPPFLERSRKDPTQRRKKKKRKEEGGENQFLSVLHSEDRITELVAKLADLSSIFENNMVEEKINLIFSKVSSGYGMHISQIINKQTNKET